MTLTFTEADYDSPVAQELIAELQAEYVERYGSGDDTPVEPDQFRWPHGLYLLGFLDGQAACSGAFRVWADAAGTAELKRMFVRRSHRGQGLSRLVLAELEARVRQAGLHRTVLETGTRQPEAIALYLSSGYEAIEPFGHYKNHEDSRCFGKTL